MLERREVVSTERRGGLVEDPATDLMIEATGVQKVYAFGSLRVHALKGADRTQAAVFAWRRGVVRRD